MAGKRRGVKIESCDVAVRANSDQAKPNAWDGEAFSAEWKVRLEIADLKARDGIE